MFPVREIFSTLKSEKDGEWADKVITFIRQNWQPLVDRETARTGMAYLLGCQDMTFIKALFQNATRINLTNNNGAGGLVNGFGQPITAGNASDEFYLKEMRALDFKPLNVWEKIKNVLVSEMKKMGPVVNVRSEDPSSTARKLKDRSRIENKKEIEGLLSYIYTSIGQQPYRMKDHEARFGQKADNGNTQQFDAMGLEGGDPADVNFFMENFYKLYEEGSIESLINFVSSYNQWSLDIEKWVIDIIAKKACASTCYVSEVTGAIMTRYLAPETVYIYGGGNRKDFNDANAKGYEVKRSIKEVLDILGDSFDMEEQFENLLQAVTNTMNIEFTGVAPSYRGFAQGDAKLNGTSNTSYNYSQFMSFKVTLGYIEFNSQNELEHGGIKQEDGYYEDNQPAGGKYATKAKWETPTYRAYYLATSQVEQVMFNFGELPYQDILGASDVSVNYTIVTYKEIGDSLAIQSAQVIDMINEAWYKFRYELRRAKPRGRGWNYDSMISSLMDLIPDTNTSQFNKLQKVMEMLDSSSNEIYTFPKGDDGRQILMPGNQLNYDIPNGMSKESMYWWEIMMNGIQHLSDMMGIAPLREGDPGNARDSMNNQFKALEYSQSATYYIPDMLTYQFQQLAVKSAFYAQDIVTYKNYNTMAYKFLEDAVGSDTLEKIENLDKTALHRFGIFVESLNQAPLRQQLNAVMMEAVKTKSITTAQYLLINDEKSVKKAFITFAFFEQRNIKIAQQQQAQQQQAQQQAMAQQQQFQLGMKKMDVDALLTRTKIEANATIQSHIINQQGGVAKTAMKVDADKEQVYHEANADFLSQQALLNNTGKTTMPPPAPPMYQAPSPEQGGSLQPAAPTHGQQLMENTAPLPTTATL